MHNKLNEEYVDYVEKKVTMQMVTLSMVLIITVLTLVSFIRIYSEKKEQVLKDMKNEAILLETVISDHLNYSKYFINMIRRTVQDRPNDLNHINNVLKGHYNSQDLNVLLGWRKYSWINDQFLELATSTRGIIEHPRQTHFIQDVIKQYEKDNINWKNNILFYASLKGYKGNSLKIIDNIVDKKTDKYMGSVVLSYDISTMIRSLNLRKTNKSTNFVILGKNLQFIAQSKPFIKNVINSNAEFDNHLNEVLRNLDANTEIMKGTSYLDMVNGVNYFVKPLDDIPLVIIVNIDNDIIKKDIIDNLAQKFVEVCIVALFCLFIIISIYKRETFLRNKAEKATIAANNATKAKTDFLAFTAHEIRSPLGFILTGSEIMTQEIMGKLPSKYKEYADGIHRNSHVILDFITDILDENQIMEGKFKIINSINNITEIIDEAITTCRARYNNRIINIAFNIEDNLPLLICDKRRMVQVVSNLISNSIKYSKETIDIAINVKNIKNELELQISDQGIGMNKEELAIALSAYGTISNSEYNAKTSYGLGLPIVKMLLDAHDARMSIKSTKGESTTITICFPKYKLVYTKN